MLKTTSFLAVVLGLLVSVPDTNAAQTYKCKLNGTVTYQQDPCPSGQVRKLPTLQELNAKEIKRREAASAAAPEKVATPEKLAAVPEKIVPTMLTMPSGYSCDGRKYCSQMKSCAEAKYFLVNCPGVKMDGDKDGIPCEEQWCTRQSH